MSKRDGFCDIFPAIMIFFHGKCEKSVATENGFIGKSLNS